MPVFTEQVNPHAFLVKWKEDGTLDSAIVEFRTLTYRDGVLIANPISNAQPVAMADGQNGLALAPIIGQLATDQAKQIDALLSESAGKSIMLDAKDQEIALLTDERNAKVAEVAALRYKLEQATLALGQVAASMAVVPPTGGV